MIPHLILNIVHWELTLYTTRKAWYFIQARRLLEWSVFFLWLLASISMNFRHRMDVSRADDLPPFFVWNVAFALSSIQMFVSPTSPLRANPTLSLTEHTPFPAL